MTARVETIPDDEWAATVAAHFVDRARQRARICVPSGDTPSPFYAEVASRISLEGLELFLLDEFGGLPPDDPGRCLSMITRDLLAGAEGKPIVHSPDVDAPNPEHAAASYGDLIIERGLDLAIVGLGANGHVGMNEPGTGPGQPTRVVSLEPSTAANAARYGATSLPTWGITVGLAELMEAAEVWVLVTGGHKADILDRTIGGVIGEDLPASFFTSHSNCTFFVDESAAVTGPG